MRTKFRVRPKPGLMKHVPAFVWPAGCKCQSRSWCKQVLRQSGPGQRKKWCVSVYQCIQTSNATRSPDVNFKLRLPSTLKFCPLFIAAQSNSAYIAITFSVRVTMFQHHTMMMVAMAMCHHKCTLVPASNEASFCVIVPTTCNACNIRKNVVWRWI